MEIRIIREEKDEEKVLKEMKNEGGISELERAIETKKEIPHYYSPVKIQLFPSAEQLKFLEENYFIKNKKNKGKMEVYKYLHQISREINSPVYLNIYWEDSFGFETDAETEDAIASVTERIYRVRTTSKDLEKIEGSINPLFPGWRSSLTGYWTKNFFDALQILNNRHNSVPGGGLSWSVISVTTLDNVVTDEELKEKMKGGNAPFDFHELFVVEVKDEDKILDVPFV